MMDFLFEFILHWITNETSTKKQTVRIIVFAVSSSILILLFVFLGIAAFQNGSTAYAAVFAILAALFVLLGIYSLYRIGGFSKKREK